MINAEMATTVALVAGNQLRGILMKQTLGRLILPPPGAWSEFVPYSDRQIHQYAFGTQALIISLA